jgi:hypothetical protein
MTHGAVPNDPHTAATLSCERCGASFRPPALTSPVTCPYCGKAQVLGAEALTQLAAYQRHVGDHHAAADEHAQHEANWQEWYGDGKGAAAGTKTFFLFFVGFALLSGGVGAGLVRAGLVPAGALPAVDLMGGFALGTIAFYGQYFYRLFHADRAKGARGGPVVVACPSCGAPGELTPGASLDQCRHCRAALVPTREIMAQGLDAAARARRAAAIARYRTERDAIIQLYRRGGSSLVIYIAFVPMVVLLTAAGIGITWETVTGEARGRPEGLLLVWLLIVGAWGALSGTLLYRRHRRDRTRAALDHLAQQFSGRRLEGIRGTGDWLNHYWGGPYPLEHFYVGSGYGAAALRVGPYAILLDYCPERAEHIVRRAQLFVAAWVPGASEGGPAQPRPEARAWIDRLAHEGWDVELQEGGVVLRARESLLHHLRHPTALHLVAPVVDSAVRLAEAAGCRPVDDLSQGNVTPA